MKRGLRILFVTPYVPSSVRVRPYAFIRQLAERGHQITLVCLVQPAWEAKYLAEVSPYCQAIYPAFLNRLEPYIRTLISLPTWVPLSVAYCRSDKFQRLIQEVSRYEFDLIHTEFMRAAPFTINLNNHPKIYDAVDSMALAYRRSLFAKHVSPKQRLISLVEWLKIRRYEPWVLEHFDRVVVSSPADRAALECNGEDGITVIPNGVDTSFFSYRESPRDPRTIVFLGKMSYYVNVASVLWFYREVFPLIKREQAEVKFKIVGRDPTSKIRALAADPDVEVTGTVPDVRPYLASATVAVCPMVSGAGIQNKLLEAMAVGTPCVATSIACQALQAELGRDVLAADSKESFAASVLALLEQPGLRVQLGINGRSYVTRYHTWRTMGDCLHNVYNEVVNNK